MRRQARAVLVVAALAAAGCGSSDDEASQAEPASGSTDSSSQSTEQATTTTDPGPAAPDASPYVEAFGDVSAVSLAAGEPDKVSIIVSGTTIDQSGSVNIIVRNNTDDEVGPIEITGTARDDAGKLVGSGESQGFQPQVVAPGEIAYGYVYFDTELAGATLQYDFRVNAQPVGDYFFPLTITEINNTGTQIIGTVSNDNEVDVTGPISVDVLCFGPDGNIVDAVSSYVEQDELAEGDTGSFAIDLFDTECAIGLVASSGYSS